MDARVKRPQGWPRGDHSSALRRTDPHPAVEFPFEVFGAEKPAGPAISRWPARRALDPGASVDQISPTRGSWCEARARASSALTCWRVATWLSTTMTAGVAAFSSPPLAQWLGPAARAFWASASTAARVRCETKGDDGVWANSWARAPAAATDRTAAARMRVTCMMDFFLTV